MSMPVKVIETEFPGVFVVEGKCFADDRGYFYETWSEPAWGAAGFHAHFVQDNLSLSKKGTLRGMHYQIEPHAIGKLVRVVSGAIFDVGVDLRIGSPTFGKWIGSELSAENHLAMWLPAGFAHGFIALEDDSILYYKCTACYAPESERSLHYADPTVAIQWPMKPTLISPKDAAAPTLDKAEYNFTF